MSSSTAEQKIAEILHLLADATNTRQLNRNTNPLFDRVLTPGFTARSAPHHTKPRKLRFDQYIATQLAVIDEFPDFHVNFTDLDIAVDEEAGTAQVFGKYEVTGQPKGVVRTYVARFWFRRGGRGQDEWRCSTFEIVEGMDGSAVTS